ncbi:MAG: acetyl-CoA C-acyltransferase [Armatimonadetes bacterium]|nr:acetyl-CoA C-acyltransferase [Armatimonadota bacterium]
MQEIAIASAVRTPIGRFGGALCRLTAVDLGVVAVKEALRRAGIEPGEVDLVIVGLARQAGCGPNPARQIGVRSGIPPEVPAYTLNQACASGLASIVQAAQNIRLQEADVVVAAGAESMSNVPYLLDSVRFGTRLGHRPLIDGMYRDGFVCPMARMVMGETVEVLAREYSISREEQDAFAASSQQKAEKAMAEGRFDAEIVAVETPEGKLSRDEHPRGGVTAEGLLRLKPVFSGEGTITAGNASGITDGASATVVVSQRFLEKKGLRPLARYRSGKIAGLDPVRMGLGPVMAVRQLDSGDQRLESFDLIELNEAFAAQVLACDREMSLPMDRVNVNGGAIALGHPIGCTGNRIVTTLLHEMARRDAHRGLATLCVSGGLGICAVFER